MKKYEDVINTGCIILIFIGFILFQGWRADWNARCFFASDASTCAMIKNK